MHTYINNSKNIYIYLWWFWTLLDVSCQVASNMLREHKIFVMATKENQMTGVLHAVTVLCVFSLRTW